MSTAAALTNRCNSSTNTNTTSSISENSYNSYIINQHLPLSTPPLSRYESQKRRDWNTFGQYLKNHRPPLTLSRCSGAHVLELLHYHDQFGKTRVHTNTCPFFGHPHPPSPCPCPLKQACGSLDALVGRLRAALEEHGGLPETNPFGGRAVRLYLREVRDSQAKARGIAYEKKKRKKPHQPHDDHQSISHEMHSHMLGQDGQLSEAASSLEGFVVVGSSDNSRSSMIPMSVFP